MSGCKQAIDERNTGESIENSATQRGIIYALNKFLGLIAKSKNVQKICEQVNTIETDVAIEYFIDCYYKPLDRIYNQGEIKIKCKKKYHM